MKCRNMQHSSGLALVAMINTIFRDYVHNYCKITTCDPLKTEWTIPYLLYQNPSECIGLTLYSIILPLKYYVFENIMGNGAFAFGANAPFSIIFSKIFRT